SVHALPFCIRRDCTPAQWMAQSLYLCLCGQRHAVSTFQEDDMMPCPWYLMPSVSVARGLRRTGSSSDMALLRVVTPATAGDRWLVVVTDSQRCVAVLAGPAECRVPALRQLTADALGDPVHPDDVEDEVDDESEARHDEDSDEDQGDVDDGHDCFFLPR